MPARSPHPSPDAAPRSRPERAGESSPAYAIFTDIDNTFKRVSGDTEEATAELFNRTQSMHIPIIAVTGLRFEQVESRIRSGNLPRFDALVSSVGTSIHTLVRNGTELVYLPDQSYAQIVESGGFDRFSLVEDLFKFMDQEAESLAGFRFRFQRPEYEAEIRAGRRAPDEPYKVSAFFEARTLDQAEHFSDLLAARVRAPCTLWCRDLNASSEAEPRFCLDLLACSKSDAVRYLADEMELSGGLVCGDSGNDIAMLVESPPQLLPVLVGGAQEEAKRIIARSLRKGPNYQSLAKFEDIRGDTREIYIGGLEKDLGPQSILKVLDLVLSSTA